MGKGERERERGLRNYPVSPDLHHLVIRHQYPIHAENCQQALESTLALWHPPALANIYKLVPFPHTQHAVPPIQSLRRELLHVVKLKPLQPPLETVTSCTLAFVRDL